MTEWVRFRKYARRMRELRQLVTTDSPSPEALWIMQLSTIDEPLLPNLKTLELTEIKGWLIPFIPLFLSPRTTSVLLTFEFELPEVMVASAIISLPTLCPNLQVINLDMLPLDSPTITAAVSGMLLATDRDTLQEFHVDSTLTEEASKVLYKLPDLRSLSVAIEEENPSPSASLPNLTELKITSYNEDAGWSRFFCGATFGKLESVTFYLQSEETGDFLEVFKRAALSSSIQNTLSRFYLFANFTWNPNYSSLLPFTQMVNLEIEFYCDDECSRVDDDIVISLSREMPKLKSLKLGDEPCREFTAGVTAKGLVALARNCPNLSLLRIHFQLASLSIPPASPRMTLGAESTASWVDCALTGLDVGEIRLPKESVLMVALTLLRIFPQISEIYHNDEGWWKVENAIYYSRQIVNCSGKQRPLLHFGYP